MRHNNNNNNNNEINCCICIKVITQQSILTPSKCKMKNGDRSHRMCEDCWWNVFALENTNHQCPGCKHNYPLIRV